MCRVIIRGTRAMDGWYRLSQTPEKYKKNEQIMMISRVKENRRSRNVKM